MLWGPPGPGSPHFEKRCTAFAHGNPTCTIGAREMPIPSEKSETWVAAPLAWLLLGCEHGGNSHECASSVRIE